MPTPTEYHGCRLCGAPPDDVAPLHPGRPETVLCSGHRTGFRSFLARAIHPDNLDPEDPMTTAAPVPTTTDDDTEAYVVLAASIGLTTPDGGSNRALEGDTIHLDRERAERFLSLGVIARPGEEPPRQRPDRPPAHEQLRAQTNAAQRASDTARDAAEAARRRKAGELLDRAGGSLRRAAKMVGAASIDVVDEGGNLVQPVTYGDVLDEHRRRHAAEREAEDAALDNTTAVSATIRRIRTARTSQDRREAENDLDDLAADYARRIVDERGFGDPEQVAADLVSRWRRQQGL